VLDAYAISVSCRIRLLAHLISIAEMLFGLVMHPRDLRARARRLLLTAFIRARGCQV
jgi:hypothetical protein